MKIRKSEEEFKSLFSSLPKRKVKTIGNPPKVQQMAFESRKPNQK